jgi:hypothetical protein
MLGAPKFLDEEMEERTKDPGVAIGLAWTAAGGEVLFIEASKMAGAGSLTLTGQLGDVMKESARAALSWLRAHAKTYGIDPDFFTKAEMHVHVPSGAIPKDGPSAGVTMATAMASELTGRPVRGDIAMTGEITLSGRVLPIGGVKEKVPRGAPPRDHEVIMPKQNAKNINEDLTPELREGLTVHLVSTIDEVLALALQPVASDRPSGQESRAARRTGGAPRELIGHVRSRSRGARRQSMSRVSGCYRLYPPYRSISAACLPTQYRLVASADRGVHLVTADCVEPKPASWDDLALVHTATISTKLRDGTVTEETRAARAAVVEEMVEAFG